MPRLRLNVSIAALACAVLIASGGCASGDKGRERSGKAVSGLDDTRKELANARKQVDETLAALAALEVAQRDLPKAFDKYKTEVKETEAQAKKTSARAKDMRAHAEEYQKKWAAEMSKVSNPELKAASETRAAKVRQRYAMISAKAQEVKAAYEPFMRDLKDVQTYLSNDLTPAAIAAAQPVFAKAKATGRDLQQRADALAADMDDVAAELSPTRKD